MITRLTSETALDLFTPLALDTVQGRGAGVVLLLAVTTAGWWLVRWRTSRFREVAGAGAHDGPQLRSDDLGVELGEVATFVQFSAATCATCPQVHRVLADVAAAEPGVTHVELDSEEHMGLVRKLAVFRTPTVLLLDARGRVLSRMSGPLTRERALTALTALAASTPVRPTSRSTHA